MEDLIYLSVFFVSIYLCWQYSEDILGDKDDD